MRAWILEQQAPVEERPLKLTDVPEPGLGDGEIRVRVLACGVCRTDIHIAEGDLPLKKSPLILGHEIVGVVEEVGRDVTRFRLGDRAGVYWLHNTCGHCKYCLSGRENYCPEIQCTGWDVDGGFAETTTAVAAYAVPLNDVRLASVEIAPLMCPGIAAYAAFKLAGVQRGDHLGLYGFGPTAYYVLKVAQFLGIQVYVSTRSQRHVEAARQAGAAWAGNALQEQMPTRLDAAILFPPAGQLVEPTLAQVQRGGALVMAPVSASPITVAHYSETMWGRDIRTLYHLKRSDAEEFFGLVNRLDLRLGVQVFPFEALPEALFLAKTGQLTQPSAVIEVSHS
ncbi:MAG: alcohol dehydrogenase catalytic domain-containing protein [Anaerolineae bacterium]|nr:alcohol dehydrogenase catalytic domain-containing protein [Anaerolineae bacterium]